MDNTKKLFKVGNRCGDSTECMSAFKMQGSKNFACLLNLIRLG